MPSKPFINEAKDALTVPRLVAVYVAVVAVALAIALPVAVSRNAAARSDHRERATLRAEQLADYFDSEVTKWLGQAKLFRGFIATASPLQAPEYWRMNSTERAQIALTAQSPDALSLAAYNRLAEQASDSAYGFRSILVQAGLINVFSGASIDVGGLDWLTREDTRPQWESMVNSSSGFYYRPLAITVAGPEALLIVVRRIVWTDISNLTSDMDAREPSMDNWHPNWRYVWGGISAVMEVTKYGNDPQLPLLVGSDFDFTFESTPMESLGIQYVRHVVANSTTPSDVQDNDPIIACSNSNDLPPVLCFRVAPKDGARWDGDDDGGQLFVVVVLIIAVPLALIVLLFLLVRLVAGPEPDPLAHLPRAVPFYAVCVDMVDSPRLWVEAPFVMHDVSTIFEAQLVATAEQHGVFISLRMGNTAIVAGTTRQKVLDFTHAMSDWATDFVWPPHISVHCPEYNTIAFSFVLHACEQVAVRVDEASGTWDVTGEDMQLLLMMRVPAVPQHVICTGQFIGLAGPGAELAAAGGARGSAAAAAAVADDGARRRQQAREIVAQVTGPVERLGVCSLPVPSATALVTPMEGFLLESAATMERVLADVLDSFPDGVWAEWQTGNDMAGNVDMLAQSGADTRGRNPLESATASHGDVGGAERSATGAMAASMSRTGNMSTANRRAVTGAHLNNDEAAERLPGSAVDPSEARKLAEALAPLLLKTQANHAPAPATTTVTTTVTTTATSKPHQRASGSDEASNLGADSSEGGPSISPSSVSSAATWRLQRALSLGTYFLAAFRIVFAPLDPAVRQAMVAKVTEAAGVPAEDYSYALAARCTRLNAHYVEADGGSGPAEENAAGPVTRRQQQQHQRNQQRSM